MTARTRQQPPGSVVRGHGRHRAFVPDPLPPRLRWDAALASRLSAADRAIGRLAGEGRRLANPHLLVRPFIRREAVLSSRIEGTQASLGELLEAEAGGAVSGDPDDLHEVANYVVALEHGVKRLLTLPHSLRLVRELHQKLMQDVRGNAATPGTFRRSQNWIGPPGSTLATATFVPPPADRLAECLAAWETFLHDDSHPPLVHAALIHAQFEAIHPFLDGNGRVGRLLITLLLVQKRVLETPLLFLSAYFELTRSEYYARLLAVTKQGAWELWLDYFLTGVTTQSDDAVGRIRRLDALLAGWRARLAQTKSKLPEKAAELFVENPYWTVKGLGERLEVAFTTAQRTIDQLETAGIAAPVTDARRNRVYCAKAVLDVLEEPAHRDNATTTKGRTRT